MLKKNTMAMFGMICFDPQRCSAMCGKIKMQIENTNRKRDQLNGRVFSYWLT